jgi:hypothetical protein
MSIAGVAVSILLFIIGIVFVWSDGFVGGLLLGSSFLVLLAGLYGLYRSEK